MKDYHSCDTNCTDNWPLIRSLQPIQAFLQPIYTIFLNFVIAFFTMFSKDTLYVIEKFDVFDSVFITIYKAFKRKLFIPDNKKYIIED